MATQRNQPYGNFNFVVSIDGIGDELAFMEVSGLGIEIEYRDYREGSDASDSVRKAISLHKYPNLVLKRGVVGSAELFQFVKGAADTSEVQPRYAKVILLDESREPVVIWKLSGVLPVKWVGPSLNAKGEADVAIEELVLAYEGITME